MAYVRKNLVGRRFGRLLVVKDAGTDKHGNALWECLCNCGNTSTVRTNPLNNGTTISCGCFQKERASSTIKARVEKERLNLEGHTSGLLTYLSEASVRRQKRFILVRCACGKEYEMNAQSFIDGTTKSCGCFKRSTSSETMKGQWKTGVLTVMDITGMRSGRLVAVKYSHSANKRRYYECLCDCGVVTVVEASRIKSGTTTTSCGCAQREASSARMKAYNRLKKEQK